MATSKKIEIMIIDIAIANNATLPLKSTINLLQILKWSLGFLTLHKKC